jgi:6-pyruvoyltetrahydropterin/6-carboxytetrahydropterin synthase
MQTTVTKKFNIQSAHLLPGYPGKCAELHGHRWEISISVTGKVNPSTGFVIDFSEIKTRIVKPLEDMFDHKLLNDCYPFKVEKTSRVEWRDMLPTAENLAGFILEFSIAQLAKYVDLWVSEVSVAETEDNIATVSQSLPQVTLGRLQEKKDASSS